MNIIIVVIFGYFDSSKDYLQCNWANQGYNYYEGTYRNNIKIRFIFQSYTKKSSFATRTNPGTIYYNVANIVELYAIEIITIDSSGATHWQTKTFGPEKNYRWAASIIYRTPTTKEKIYENYLEADEEGTIVVTDDNIGFKLAPDKTDDDDIMTLEDIYNHIYVPSKNPDRTYDCTSEHPLRFKINEENKCSGKHAYANDHNICENCKQHLINVANAIDTMSGELETYHPYIAEVTNHWYRNVYFVNPRYIYQNDSIASPKIVSVDKEFEKKSGERWTTYEKYTSENVVSGAKVGDEVLFLVIGIGSDSDVGGFATNTSQILGYDDFDQKIKDKIVLYKNVYYVFTGTQKEAKDYGVPVAKRAEGTEVNDNVLPEKWVAYEEDKSQQIEPWTQVYGEEVTNAGTAETVTVKTGSGENDTANLDKKAASRIFIHRENTNPIIQVEDGRRGVTNNKIKNLFVNNYYFQFDGSPETADKIYAIKRALSGEEQIHEHFLWIETRLNGQKLKRESLGHVDLSKFDNGLDTTIAYTSFGSDPGSQYASLGGQTEHTEKLRDIVGHVSLTKDSLTAFSMLENTHTLDADYIYRDFKELIVELGYFKKEELSEGLQVFSWLIPKISPFYGWPWRGVDKDENEYGTYINPEGSYSEIDTSDPSGAISLKKDFSGFSSGDKVVAPATGKVLKSEGDTVVIQVLDKKTMKELEAGGGFNFDDTKQIPTLPSEDKLRTEEKEVQKKMDDDKISKKEAAEKLIDDNKLKFMKPWTDEWKGLDLSKIDNNNSDPDNNDSEITKEYDYYYKFVDKDGKDISDTKKQTYGYRLFFNKYDNTGVAGNLLIISGISVGIDSSDDGDMFNQLYNKETAGKSESLKDIALREAELDAKYSVPAYNGNIIKEGTVIGTTTGNPVKIIMKTTSDEIVENVEYYIKNAENLEFERIQSLIETQPTNE